MSSWGHLLYVILRRYDEGSSFYSSFLLFALMQKVTKKSSPFAVLRFNWYCSSDDEHDSLKRSSCSELFNLNVSIIVSDNARDVWMLFSAVISYASSWDNNFYVILSLRRIQVYFSMDPSAIASGWRDSL